MSSPPLRPIRVIGKADKTGNVQPTIQFLRWLEDQQRTVDGSSGSGFDPVAVMGLCCDDMGPV